MPTGPAPAPALLVSACLLGVRCNHRGEASPSAAVAALGDRYRLVAICPETAGGLPTPRPAAELQSDGSVQTAAGEDVTWAYRRGAEAAVALATTIGAREAVLKARSPSCGCAQVYDGTFSRTLRAGRGVTAEALERAGVTVRSEEDLGAER
ncbi:MAG: 2-thiouracil desulfurase family protein [Acidimicrobiales bacterium]